MNPDYEKRLETEIDRELKGLPELPAPGTLARRVMAAIEQRDTAPWYRQAWQNWPFLLRATALLGLVSLFGVLCFAGWKVPRTAEFSLAMQQVGGWFSSVTAIWNALNSLAATLLLLFKQLGTGVLLGCLAAMALAWVMCLGLGTFCVRLALMRR